MSWVTVTLAALDSSLQGRVADQAAEAVISAGCFIVGACIRAMCSTGPPVPPSQGLSCACFVLHSGAAAQRYMRAAFADGQASATDVADCMGSQIIALDSWLRLVGSLPAHPSTAALAEQCAPPALLHLWVRETEASLHALEQPSWKPGASPAQGGMAGSVPSLISFAGQPDAAAALPACRFRLCTPLACAGGGAVQCVPYTLICCARWPAARGQTAVQPPVQPAAAWHPCHGSRPAAASRAPPKRVHMAQCG